MSQMLTINVINYEQYTQGFYFFQQPGIYVGGGNVYSNSLYSSVLGNYQDTGAVLTFVVNQQNYAGIQQSNSPPQVGVASGYVSASRAIDLASGNGAGNDWTTAMVSPALGLTAPVNGAAVPPGAFRVTTPVFSSPPYYNVGSAVGVNGGIVLSNFIQAMPACNIDCQPSLKYYVQTGQYTPGTVMNFTQSSVNAAVCDFSSGYTTANVSLNMDGTWSVHMQ